MNNSDISFINLHRIDPNGTVSSHQYEVDNISQVFIMKTRIAPMNFTVNFEVTVEEDKLNLKSRCLELGNSSVRVIKIGDVEDLNPMNYATEVSIILNYPCETKPQDYAELIQPKRESKIPNIPTMIICQNCDTNFPTKYQYQRHQCKFNAERVVLKPNVDIKDIEKGMRVKFDCPTCGKQFVSKNNLERHQSSHDETNLNICEHCNKQFVSENRLRIHKENHCKKAGDISKFYRSDVAVWKCFNCCQVFATLASAIKHAENCQEIMVNQNCSFPVESFSETKPDKNVQKLLTELLLQCEFCNRTYADKNWLLIHQKMHTTAINYQCVVCKESFDSYITASKHWLTKCSDEAKLFYLPKLIYCEHCDRTFKSHEILYTHKYKKKHYTPKMYAILDATKDGLFKTEESKDTIVKLIEDVLIAINPEVDEIENNIKSEEEVVIKTEICNETDTPLDTSLQENTEKKRAGRKGKTTKPKLLSTTADSGYKYQCERCIKVWDSVAELENHREVEHPANFKCDECEQVVHSAKALLIHNRAHQSLKPYICEICKRCYSQTSHLWQHMRFHQGIKPFACPHEGCEARYTIRPDLKDHIRKVHTRERPFKCTVCDKCFLTGSVYYQHRLIHTNDRRYGCDICLKRFFRADALNNHRRIHTDERPYPCDICGRQFRQKGDRNKHMRTQHSS